MTITEMLDIVGGMFFKATFLSQKSSQKAHSLVTTGVGPEDKHSIVAVRKDVIEH